MTHTRIKFETCGAHVHAEFFSRDVYGGYAHNGRLIFNAREWENLREVFDKHPERFELVDQSPRS